MENQKNSKMKTLKPYRGVTVRDKKFSESYEEYLEIIYRLSLKNPGGWVKNKEISERLKVKAPSVTNMLEKLSKAKLIDWKPRSGIRLTDIGRDRAKDLITYHIIIELFLCRILKMSDPILINSIACDFEHHITNDLKERFINLLGINENLTNVDNFILENKLPKHIVTRPIYTEEELIEVFISLQKKISSTINLDTSNEEKMHNFIQSYLKEKTR